LALNEVGVLALPYIVLRNDHIDSLAAGLGVSEFAPDSVAAAEIRALWAWSKQRLAMNSAAKKQAPEHDEVPATQTRPDDAVGIVNNDPLYNVVLQSFRLAALPWTPWLQPPRTSAAKHADDQPRTE
jgi:hypothetical protein